MSLELKDGTRLSRRQVELLVLLDRGFSNEEIARAINITHHTVKVHMLRLMRRLNANNRGHLVFLAKQKGFIVPNFDSSGKVIPVDTYYENLINLNQIQYELDCAVEFLRDLTAACLAVRLSGLPEIDAMKAKAKECQRYLKMLVKKYAVEMASGEELTQ